MPILRQGDSGKVIDLLNGFLDSLGLSHDSGSVFGIATHEGVKKLQSRLAVKSSHIKVDGIAGNRTLGHACALSPSDAFSPQTIAAALGIGYPPRLAGLPGSLTTDRMHKLFGRIEYKETPLADNKEHITITNDWEQIPQKSALEGCHWNLRLLSGGRQRQDGQIRRRSDARTLDILAGPRSAGTERPLEWPLER